MNILFITLEAITFISVIMAIMFLLKEKKARKNLQDQKKEITRKWYELSALTNLSEEIGYSLDARKVIERLTATIESIFPYTGIAYLERDESVLRFKVVSTIPLGKTFIETSKKKCLEAAYILDPNTRALSTVENIEAKITSKDDIKVQSYFNVPLVINHKFVGLIFVASNQKYQYKIEDMAIIYNVAKHAVKTIERIQSIIQTEKGRLDSLLLSISTGAIMFSIKDNVMELSAINTAAKEFLNLEGNIDTYKVLTSFSRDTNLQENIKKVLEQKATSIIEEVKINDQIFKIFLNPVFLFGAGKIIGVSITMQNMTLEKQIQEIRETFTHMVVHELRAPLTSMKGASELLLSGKLSPPEQAKMLQLVKDSTVRMLTDISDLLDASKIEAGKFEIYKQESNINDVIKERVQIFMHLANQKMITVTTSLEQTLPVFDFDRERIGQVLNNLLSNSIKYTHQGGKIELKSKVEGQYCRVEIIDNGIGIPKEKQARLFSKYSQAGQGGFKSGTTGLGLYISKSIVESHEGKISLQSEDGKGTTIFFMIPIAHAKRETQDTPMHQFQQSRVVN